MDGYKSDPETGGGWYGDGILGHLPFCARTTTGFNSPFEKNATDGIIHEFGRAGVPDIHAMKVDA